MRYRLVRRRRESVFAALLGLLGILAFSAPATAAPNPSLLSDGRGWELVSPPNKHGATINPAGEAIEGPLGGLVQASEDGSAIVYNANAPVEQEPEANRSPEGEEVISSRGENAWSTRQIITPHTVAEGFPSGTATEYKLFSPDLSAGVLAPFGLPGHLFQEPPLSEGLEPEERGIYMRRRTKCDSKPVRCYEALVTPANNTGGAQFGGQLEFLGTSHACPSPLCTPAIPALEHVVFKSSVTLTSTPPAAPGLYEWSKEEAGGKLQLISILPNEEAAPEAELADNVESVSESGRDAVSSSGRAFWLGSATERDHLFVRDPAAGVSIQVNAPQPGVHHPPPENEAAFNEVRYQIASVDGSRVFFTSTVPLTTDSKQGIKELEIANDELYVCELPTPLAKSPACPKLTDLTIPPESCGKCTRVGKVLGTVIGASSDGTWVYFAGDGILTEEANARGETAKPGSCPTARSGEEATSAQHCNIYVRHFNGTQWEPTKLVAVVSGLDNRDWAEFGVRMFKLTAQVSPNGRYLAFMSEKELTHQGSVDASPAAEGKHDEEVFVYDSSTGALVCPSCNPRGEHPTGVFDTQSAGEGGTGLVVDPFSFGWSERWLAGSVPGYQANSETENYYQSRYMLDNGRLFFNSSDKITPAHEGEVSLRAEKIGGKEEKVGVMNVYEFQPAGVGSCTTSGGCVSALSPRESPHESAFLDASASGNDAFFLTAQQLVTSDTDGNYDAYDAHVCSPTCIQPPTPSSELCSAIPSCRSGSATQESTSPGGTSTFGGSANSAAHEVRPIREEVKKPLTRAQLLAKALASCRKKFKHAKKKRAKCERQARARYGVKKASHHHGSHKK